MKKQFLTFLFFALSIKVFAQEADLKWLNANAVALNDHTALTFLDKELEDNQVCTLGEATHGTHEFFEQKATIVKYLVTNLHYRYLCFEMGYSLMEPINNYVTTGNGDLKKMLQPMHLYNVQEIFDLFEWMRQYNIQHPQAQVSIYGFDTDFMQSDVQASGKLCYNYFTKHSPQRIDLMQPMHTVETSSSFDGFDDKQKKVLNRYYDSVAANRPVVAEDKIFLKHLQLLLQLASMGNPLARDEFMAKNVIQLQQENQHKLILWGHNVHLAADTTLTNYRGTGWFLRKQYGKTYYAIGTDAYEGEVNVLDQDDMTEKHNFTAQTGTYSALFSSVKYPSFFVSFRKADNPFAGSARNIIFVTANWGRTQALPIRPGVDFDAIIFFRKTTASKSMY